MDGIIDISAMDFESPSPRSAGSGSGSGSGSGPRFGGGIELLMNESKSSRSQQQSIDLDDLQNLESELNDLSQYNRSSHGQSNGSNASSSSFFGFGLEEDKPTVHFTEPEEIRLDSIPDEYQPQSAHEKTWDGYGKFNDIPVNPDVPSNSTRSSSSSFNSDQPIPINQMMKKKKTLLMRLRALERKGVELQKKYDEDSDIQDIMAELEVQAEEVARMESIKFQGQMMLAVVNGIEFLSKRSNPFDIQLDGFGDQVTENIHDYDDMFGELHNKWKDRVYIPPELRILYTLGSSAALVHFSNTMLKNSMPGIDEIFRQDPNLMRQFQASALNSLHKNSPGLANFMNGSVTASGAPNPMSAPPAPINTRDHNMPQPPSNRGGNHIPPPSIHVYGQEQQQQQQQQQQHVHKSTKRPDMKGPSDVSHLLSGLRTRTIDIQDPHQDTYQDTYELKSNHGDSPSSVTDMGPSSTSVKRSNKRKPKSDKNTVSLDM